MKSTIAELLGSKRFVVTVLAVLACTAFVVAGKMPVGDFIKTFTQLSALLATLYGVENAAAAFKGSGDGGSGAGADGSQK